ncbi:tyrosine-type recombinase/integrase [Streptomyces sp. MBT55]|uniref:tyrosine-type recombinase/integrase n=1 Tax=Streptomyces sp. MBT55 TaxID=1488386 RepID=UPI00191403DE|nr:tyrosine-type recombinase/integrase [Streptomyces sp. MBT55]MBK6040820.1 tyrosine-type recombinase/integrase [Streptomyces sp. MBT55]
MTDIERREQSFAPAVRQLSDEARAALAAGRADSTRKAYREDREAFIAWCKKQGEQPLPATQDLLIEYITHLTLTPRPRTGRPSAPSSLERMLSAITTMHAELDLPKPETKGARTVIAGYKHQLAIDKKPGGKQQQAKAALPAALRKMLATLDRDTLIGKRDAAMLLLGYAAATRSSELVGIDINEPVEDDKGYLVSIYRVKMKKFTESAIAYGKSPATCPVRALRALITAMHEEGRTDGPLFVRIDRHGRIAPPMTRKGKPIGDPSGRLTPDAASDVVERLADAAGFQGRWRGHSLRRGFATAAQRGGAPMIRVARQGGWADNSTSLARYFDEGDPWEDNPVMGL